MITYANRNYDTPGRSAVQRFAATNQGEAAQLMHGSTGVQSQLQMRRSLNSGPAAVAQAKLADMLAAQGKGVEEELKGKAGAQRKTEEEEKKMK